MLPSLGARDAKPRANAGPLQRLGYIPKGITALCIEGYYDKHVKPSSTSLVASQSEKKSSSPVGRLLELEGRISPMSAFLHDIFV
jgi:hypothetical protein